MLSVIATNADKKSDNHTNCANLNCNLLFIQCSDCKKKTKNCCSPACLETALLSEEEQKKIRAKREKTPTYNNHRKVDLSLNFKK
jgi:predicted sulfurtransferase